MLNTPAMGHITDKTEIIKGVTTTYHYEYDLTSRLVSVKVDGSVTKYRYDENGNRTHVNEVPNATYDNQDRLVVPHLLSDVTQSDSIRS
jgi:hypothetical protein